MSWRVAAKQAGSPASRHRRPGPQQQHDPSQAQHLLGTQPTDRAQSKRGDRRRLHRGLARGRRSPTDATPDRQRQAHDQLPSCDRFAGPQAGRVRELPVPGGHVSHQSLSHRLRLFVPRSRPTQGRPRIPEDSAAGGPGQSGCGAGCAASGHRPRHGRLVGVNPTRRGRASTSAAGDRRQRRAAGPE